MQAGEEEEERECGLLSSKFSLSDHYGLADCISDRPLILLRSYNGQPLFVPGIGYVTECNLKAFGVERIVDLWKRRGILYHLTSPTALNYYMRITLGHCEDEWADGEGAPVSGFSGQRSACQKSMSTERTFQDCSDPDILQAKCRQLCISLVKDMKEAHVQCMSPGHFLEAIIFVHEGGKCYCVIIGDLELYLLSRFTHLRHSRHTAVTNFEGKTVTMKLKLDTFEVRTRSQTLPDYTCSTEIIFQCASEILKDETKAEWANNSKVLTLRLMGVRISNLVPSAMCQQFRQETLESAFDRGFKGAKDKENCEVPLSTCHTEIQDTSILKTKLPTLIIEKEPTAKENSNCPTTVCPVCSKELKLKDLEQPADGARSSSGDVYFTSAKYIKLSLCGSETTSTTN
ncbi:hypothetical protein ACTXT7_005309 [Hymenolepis weldensis]